MTTLELGEWMLCDPIVKVADMVGMTSMLSTVAAHDPSGTEVTDADPVYFTITDGNY